MTPTKEITTASKADLVEMENLRKRMMTLLERMDRLLVPLMALRNGGDFGTINPDASQTNQAEVPNVMEEEQLAIETEQPNSTQSADSNTEEGEPILTIKPQ